MKKIVVASDHAGVEYKQEIKLLLENKDFQVIDKGPFSQESVDYPDFIHPAAKALNENEVDLAVILCGSGNGAAMTANKYKNVRCGLCWTKELVALTRQHNNANMISIPARFVSLPQALEMVETFISTEFEAGRHQRRVDKIASC